MIASVMNSSSSESWEILKVPVPVLIKPEFPSSSQPHFGSFWAPLNIYFMFIFCILLHYNSIQKNTSENLSILYMIIYN